MIFYLGEKVDVIDDSTRLLKNKTKSWKYGYNEAIDTVIISKDGTLGEVYRISGINIGLPEPPKDKKEIINSELLPVNQKWKREELPSGINESNWFESRYEKYVNKQFKYRDEGCFIYLNGKLVYITGTYWFFIQWYREESDYPLLRIIQNELMIFWEACKADERSYGMMYGKNRRFGASALGNTEELEAGTIHENKILGTISKKGNDAKKLFNRLVRAFKRLPPFFKPETDGNSTPKTELVLTEQNRKRKAGETVTEGQGLDTIISWHNTEINAMDGEKIFRSLIDECGKWPKEVPFSEYWYIVKTSHRIGSNIVGKAFVCSTVNAMKKGGAEFKKVWNDSDATERNQNGQTKSGLYRLFIDAVYCLEGFFDEYGFSITEDPIVPIKNDLGKFTKIGADTFLKNELEALKDDPDKYNEFLRQFPRSERDMLRDESSDCSFNLMKLLEQIEHNEYELDDSDSGNKLVERGNFVWKDGIPYAEAVWKPDPVNGRFWIRKDCHPPIELRNRKVQKFKNGIQAFAPVNEDLGCLGVDPFNRSKTSDGRGSQGGIHLFTKMNTLGFPNNAFILEYIDRPPKIEMFYEDVIMAMVYFSVPILPEMSSDKFSQYLVDKGFRHFVLNNPFKKWKELTPEEKRVGGVNAQNASFREAQFQVVNTYVEDHIGVARESEYRPLGDMGIMPFTRTLIQWKDTDPDNRTDFDAYISSSLAMLGCQSRFRVKVEEKKPIRIPFNQYDNSGNISVLN